MIQASAAIRLIVNPSQKAVPKNSCGESLLAAKNASRWWKLRRRLAIRFWDEQHASSCKT
ncbi:MAG: hypothetical protein DMG61_09645 [Acidobacteria bacterium]|nr:MAG: hypothetical protein DMG61_09645 [Acidobacteriota bacterium]